MTGAAARLPDAVDDPFILRLAPQSWRPFLQLARIDRPIGWWLLILPCWQSSALASVRASAPPHWRDLLLFLIGAIAMRGAGSTYNDIIDRKLDAGTHLMHLETGRHALYEAVGQALKGETP